MSAAQALRRAGRSPVERRIIGRVPKSDCAIHRSCKPATSVRPPPKCNAGSGVPDILPEVARGVDAAPSRESLALLVLRPEGAVATGTAAFSRIGRIFGSLYAIWGHEEQDAAQVARLRGTMAVLSGLLSGGCVGESDLGLPGGRRDTHAPAAAARLAALRAIWDPNGLFGAAFCLLSAEAA